MKCRAALQIWSETRTAAEVARRLGLAPTRSCERGDVWGVVRPRRRTQSLWELATGYSDNSDLDDLLGEILRTVEPVSGLVRDLLADGYRARWWCYVEALGSERAIDLPAALLTRLAALGADLLIDTYGAEAD